MKKGLCNIEIFILLVLFLSTSYSYAYTDGVIFTEFENSPNKYTKSMNGVDVRIDKSMTQKSSTVTSAAHVNIDGVPIVFSESTGYPYVDSNGRVQVPLRAVMEAFGCEVKWDGASNKRMVALIKDESVIIVPIERKAILVSRWEYAAPTDSVAIIKDGKIYTPIRKVLEFFGAKVEWDKDTKTVSVISSPSSTVIKEGQNIRDVVSEKTAAYLNNGITTFTGYKILDNGNDYKLHFISCTDHINGKLTRLSYFTKSNSILIDKNGEVLSHSTSIESYYKLTAVMFDCDFSKAEYIVFKDYTTNTLILVPTSSIT